MNMKRSAIYLCTVLVAFLSLGNILQLQRSPAKEVVAVGFPFSVEEETKIETRSGPMWSVALVVLREHYTKESIDRLFRSFAGKYNNTLDRVRIKIYTSKSNFERETTDQNLWLPGSTTVYHDAIFERYPVNPPVTTAYNEWYIYRIDPDTALDKVTIIKGTLPFRRKTVLETKELAGPTITLRITSYDLEGVEPAGTYVTIERQKEKTLKWEEVMSFRGNRILGIPNDQVHFLGEKVVFMFAGWMYACTVDGGEKWSVWDAADSLADWKYCRDDLIQSVDIAPDGTGRMKLSLSPWILYTNDHGKKWSPTPGNRTS